MKVNKNKNKNSDSNNNIENLNLDSYHEKILSTIEIDESKIPELYRNIDDLKSLLEKETNIDKKLDLKDQIHNIKTNIKRIKRAKKEYLLENSQYIFDYFEQKKNISISSSLDELKTKENKIDLEFFFNNKRQEAPAIKNENVEKYFQNVINNVNMSSYYFDSNHCSYCNEGELIFIENEGVIICNNCYNTNKFYIENDKPNYREPPKEVCFYAYKRINHL